MNLSELETTVRKYLLLADPHIIRLLCGFIIASRLPINPTWLFIVGPPSGGKSTLLKALQGLQGIFPLDNLTPNTFISGMRGQDGKSNSLLDKLLPNSTILFEDFTTIISKDDASREEIIGQMRKIYDGNISKVFGNGVEFKRSDLHLSVLAGVTEKIYPSMGMFADMGERFLMWKFLQLDDIPGRKAVGRMAADNMNDKPGAEAMKKAFTELIEHIPIPDQIPQLDETTKTQIIDLAELVTRARTPVLREKFNREKPIIQVYSPERTPRFIKQVLGLALGLQILNGGTITDDDRVLLCKMALDSIPSIRRKCLQELTAYDQVETPALAVAMGYPVESIKMHLQDLAALDVIEFRKGGRHQDRWRLLDEYRVLITEHDHVKQTGEVLEVKEEVPEAGAGDIPPEFNL